MPFEASKFFEFEIWDEIMDNLKSNLFVIYQDAYLELQKMWYANHIGKWRLWYEISWVWERNEKDCWLSKPLKILMIHLNLLTLVRYRLTCKKCNIDQIHTAQNYDTLAAFWRNWSLKNAGLMKCNHEYVFEQLEWSPKYYKISKTNTR